LRDVEPGWLGLVSKQNIDYRITNRRPISSGISSIERKWDREESSEPRRLAGNSDLAELGPMEMNGATLPETADNGSPPRSPIKRLNNDPLKFTSGARNSAERRTLEAPSRRRLPVLLWGAFGRTFSRTCTTYITCMTFISRVFQSARPVDSMHSVAGQRRASLGVFYQTNPISHLLSITLCFSAVSKVDGGGTCRAHLQGRSSAIIYFQKALDVAPKNVAVRDDMASCMSTPATQMALSIS